MEQTINQQEYSASKSFCSRVYLCLALALLTSGLTAIGLSYLFNYIFPITQETNFIYYYVILGIGILGLIIVSIVMSFKQMRGTASIPILIIYSLMMGIVLSGLTIYVEDPSILGYAFILSALVFLISSGVGFLINNKVASVIVSILVCLSIGIGVMFILNLFLLPLSFLGNNYQSSETMYWIIESVFLVVMIIMTIVDTFRVKSLVKSSYYGNSLAVSCALSLYLDFVYIFVIIFRILVSARRSD